MKHNALVAQLGLVRLTGGLPTPGASGQSVNLGCADDDVAELALLEDRRVLGSDHTVPGTLLHLTVLFPHPSHSGKARACAREVKVKVCCPREEGFAGEACS